MFLVRSQQGRLGLPKSHCSALGCSRTLFCVQGPVVTDVEEPLFSQSLQQLQGTSPGCSADTLPYASTFCFWVSHLSSGSGARALGSSPQNSNYPWDWHRICWLNLAMKSLPFYFAFKLRSKNIIAVVLVVWSSAASSPGTLCFAEVESISKISFMLPKT